MVDQGADPARLGPEVLPGLRFPGRAGVVEAGRRAGAARAAVADRTARGPDGDQSVRGAASGSGGVRSGPRPGRRARRMRGCRLRPAGTPRPARSTSRDRHQRQQGPSPVCADGPADHQRGGLGVGQVGRRGTCESPSLAGGLADGQVTPDPQGTRRLVAEQQVEDHHLAVFAPRPRPALGGRATNLGGTDRTRSTAVGLPGSPGPVDRRCGSARRPAPLPPGVGRGRRGHRDPTGPASRDPGDVPAAAARPAPETAAVADYCFPSGVCRRI